VYGDSIVGDEPLLLKKDGLITLITIEELCNEWKPYHEFKKHDSNRKEKEQSHTKYQVWCDGKWSNIKRVIRHKTLKKIYRINTHCGVVDVTEDHSLLDEKYNKITPNKCVINTKLLQSFPTFNVLNKPLHFDTILNILNQYELYERNLLEKEAFIFGFFYGDGSCGYYNCKSGNKYSWALNNQNRKLLEMCKKYLIELYSEKTNFIILETMKSSGVLKLVPKGSIKYMVKLFRHIFYNKKRLKIVPNKILNGNYNIRLNFFLGYYAADGCKKICHKVKNINFDNKGKIGSAQLYYIVKSLGYNVSIRTRKDKLNIYKITCTINKQRKISNSIKKIYNLRETINEEYVYDLETEEGLFQAGVGEIIVKNTDSVFIKYNLTDDNGKKLTGLKALEKSIEMGIKTEKAIQPLLRSPHVLEYEKTFYPFILLSKKRYVGNLYEKDINKFYRKSMGIVLKRRDNANIVKKVYGGIIDIIMSEKNIKKAITFLEKAMNNILKGTYPIEDFVITKTLRGHYKNPGSISHKVLADRMTERDPGSAPNTNERVPYAFIQIKKNKVIESKKKKIMTYLTSFSKKYTHTDKINKLAKKYTTKINNICNLGDEFNNVQHTLKLLATSNSSSNIIKHKILGLISKRIKVLQGDRVEHPDFIKKHKLPLDYNYYITNQIMKPVKQIFDLVMNNTHIIFDDIIRKDKNKTNNNQEITKWFASDKKSDSNYDKYKWKV